MAVKLLNRRLNNIFMRQLRNGYIVLLPEVNTDSAEKNPLFLNGLPDFEKLSCEKCVNSFGKIILDFEHSIRGLEDDILARALEREKKESIDIFDDVIDHIETAGVGFESTWGLLKILCYVDQNLMPLHTYLPLNDRARMALALKYNNHHIYKAIKNYDVTKLTEEEQRVAAKFLIEGKLNGLDLSGDQKLVFSEISRKMAKHCHDFKSKNDLTKGLFRHVITDFPLVQDFPQHLLQSIAVDGGWAISLRPDIYEMILERCPSRMVRQNAWLAYNHSSTSHPELSNSASLENIRSTRKDLAKLLGYKNFAEMSMETKMAGTVENVHGTLQAVLERAYPLQKEEMMKLEEFGRSCGLKGSLEEYDIPWLARLHRRHLLEWDDEKMSEYFSLDRVLGGLFEVTESLLGIRLRRVDGADVPHPTVSYYHISENNNVIAGLYIDPYRREKKGGGCASVCLRPSSKFHEHHPVSYLTCDFSPPSLEDSTPSLLTLFQVEQLFTKFGTALQQVLSTVNYSEVSGLSFVEWDAVEVVRNIFSICLNEESVLEKICCHHKTGERLEADRIRAVLNHMIGYKTCKQIYLSSVDLLLHSTERFWLSIVKDEWSRCMFNKLNEKDHSICGFTESLVGPLSAAYYSRLWSKILAHDIYYNAFAHLPDQTQLTDIGSRFRDTFLAFGGSCEPGEVFRRFQGRDPTPDAFVRSLAR